MVPTFGSYALCVVSESSCGEDAQAKEIEASPPLQMHSHGFPLAGKVGQRAGIGTPYRVLCKDTDEKSQ